jgi:uncharacterized protein
LPSAVPFRQFIVKLHSRCNLSCSYCYIYHHVDQTWRRRPKVMSAATIEAMARRIGEHVGAHALPRVVVVLHGGEPLLAGPAVIDRTITAIRAAAGRRTQVDVTLQTNGTLLDEPLLELFHRHRVGVGVSLDGGAAATNRHRVHADGRPSFDEVERALRLLLAPRHRAVYAGVLCTVDLANDPVGVYEDLLAFAPPQMDLLLPLGNWVHPPPQRTPDETATPYADWLVPVFDRWFDAPRRETGIRLFDSLMSLLVGGPSDTEAVGLDSANAITVETDGSLEVTDALKTSAPGLGATGLNVQDDALDRAACHPLVLAAQRRLASLSAACRACRYVGLCGGGQFSHRFGTDGGFLHRSVYCADLLALIGHIERRLERELRARRARRLLEAG